MIISCQVDVSVAQDWAMDGVAARRALCMVMASGGASGVDILRSKHI